MKKAVEQTEKVQENEKSPIEVTFAIAEDGQIEKKRRNRKKKESIFGVSPKKIINAFGINKPITEPLAKETAYKVAIFSILKNISVKEAAIILAGKIRKEDLEVIKTFTENLIKFAESEITKLKELAKS